MKKNLVLLLFPALLLCGCRESLPVMETGGQSMPDAWIDADTGHKVFKLVKRDGANHSTYFHNNPFIGEEMIFSGEDAATPGDDMNFAPRTESSQMYAVNLRTRKVRRLTDEPFRVRTEIMSAARNEIFYTHEDSVLAVNVGSLERRFVGLLPKGGGITCVNCDGTLLAGVIGTDKEAEILRANPQKSSFFNLIWEAHLRKTIYTMDTVTGQIDSVFSDNEWLNHLQFSPTDPHLLSFCHEGPWHFVDRMWNIDVVKKNTPVLLHKRTMPMEIAGHEWFGNLGTFEYFDLQKPKSENFYVGRVNLETLEEEDFAIRRENWSVHFVTSWDETVLAGDGGDPVKSVAHSPEDQWIFLYRFAGDSLKAERLVNMKNHDYKLEPNVHFSPDQKLVIFRANFEGVENIYAVEL